MQNSPELSSVLVINSPSRRTLIKTSFYGFTTILVYVDDLALVEDDLSKINNMKQLLDDDKFHIKYLGKLNQFLGLVIARSEKGRHPHL